MVCAPIQSIFGCPAPWPDAMSWLIEAPAIAFTGFMVLRLMTMDPGGVN